MYKAGPSGSANQTGAGSLAMQQVAQARGSVFTEDEERFTENVRNHGLTTNLEPCVSSNERDALSEKSRPLPPSQAGPNKYPPDVPNAAWSEYVIGSTLAIPSPVAPAEEIAAHERRRTGLLFLISSSVGESVDKYVEQNNSSRAPWTEFQSGDDRYRYRNEVKSVEFNTATLDHVGASPLDFGTSRCTPRLTSCAQIIEKQVRQVGDICGH